MKVLDLKLSKSALVISWTEPTQFHLRRWRCSFSWRGSTTKFRVTGDFLASSQPMVWTQGAKGSGDRYPIYVVWPMNWEPDVRNHIPTRDTRMCILDLQYSLYCIYIYIWYDVIMLYTFIPMAMYLLYISSNIYTCCLVHNYVHMRTPMDRAFFFDLQAVLTSSSFTEIWGRWLVGTSVDRCCVGYAG